MESGPPVSPASTASMDAPSTPDGDGSLGHLDSRIRATHLNTGCKSTPMEQYSPDQPVQLQGGAVTVNEEKRIRSKRAESLSQHEEGVGARTAQSNLEGENALERLHSTYSSSVHTEHEGEESNHEHLMLKGDEEDEEMMVKSGDGRNGGDTTPKEMTDEEVLHAIEKELGVWKCADLPGGKEVVIAHEASILLKKILIRGYTVLTNHRFCFIAYLPNNKENDKLSGHSQPNRGVIRAEPATLHRPGLTRRKRKAWFVLSHHSITAYHSSEELYEPLGGIKLSDIREVSPHRLHGKDVIHFKSKGHSCYLEFETQEAVQHWIKDIDIARWRLNNDIDKIRISVPLVRIAGLTSEDYLHVFNMTHLDILHDSLYSSSGHRHHEHIHLHHKQSEAAEAGRFTTELAFGHLKETSRVIKELQPAVEKAKKWRELREKTEWWSFPPAIIEIDGAKAHPDDDEGSEEDGRSMQKRIIDEFSLNCKPEEVQLVKADIVRTIPSTGTFALSPRYMCFYRRHRLTGLSDTRIKIPVGDLNKVMATKAFRWHHYGLRVQILAHADVIFEFSQRTHRDEVMKILEEAIANAKEQVKEEEQKKTRTSLTSYGHALAMQAERGVVTLSPEAINKIPKAVNTRSTNRPIRIAKLKVMCLTIGSRGDVQPYIALCKQLQKHNHECIIVSHGEYKEWVESYGIGFRAAGGDPGELMKLSVENKMFSPQFFREAISKFKHWLDDLLRDIMDACWDADLIIESPSTFGGIHVAEAIGCYYMRAFTMPWTKTSAYPQAFSVPNIDMGPQYNLMSYTMFDQILWTASSGQINRWRKNMLNLEPTDMNHLKTSSIPFMYNFSPAVVPPPLDWGSLTAVTGYWFVREDDDKKYDAPKELVEFIAKAKRDEKKLAYIGFGSITIADPRGTQKAIYEAVQKSDVRAIVSKGWSERMEGKEGGKGSEEGPLEVPKEVFTVDSIPHDWLFPQIDIAMHHGGAGTTGASLKAGLVTLIHPFFGDQYFWSSRVDKLGAGVRVKSLKTDAIAEALTKARDDRVMREKAQVVGQSIQEERGVESALAFIYTNLERSKRVPRTLKEDRRQSTSSLPGSGRMSPQKVNSEGSDSEDEALDSVSPAAKSNHRRSLSFGNNGSSLSNFKRAAYHPLDVLMSRSPSDSAGSSSPVFTDHQVSSPGEVDHKVIDDGDQKEGKDSQDHMKGHSNWLALHHSLTFQRPSNMPHMSMPSILKMGLGNGDKGTDGNLTDEEKEKQRQESHEKHLSAKEEDRKRREALLDRWVEAGRSDLLSSSEREVVDQRNSIPEEDEQERTES